VGNKVQLKGSTCSTSSPNRTGKSATAVCSTLVLFSFLRIKVVIFAQVRGVQRSSSLYDPPEVNFNPLLLKPAAFNAPLNRCWSCGDILTAEVSSLSEATAASASRIQVSLFSDVSSHLATSSNTPGDLECQIEAFVDHYNHQRYHNS
jgi:hypothetical protein